MHSFCTVPSISSRIESTHTSVVVVGYSPPTIIRLTCIIELPASVDTAVNVSTVWTGPSGAEFEPRNHISTINFGRSYLARYSSLITVIKSGHYMCQTNVTSLLQFISGNVMASQVHDIVSGKAILIATLAIV